MGEGLADYEVKDDPFDAPMEESKMPSAFEVQKGRSQSLSVFSKDNSQGFRMTPSEKEEVRKVHALRFKTFHAQHTSA